MNTIQVKSPGFTSHHFLTRPHFGQDSNLPDKSPQNSPDQTDLVMSDGTPASDDIRRGYALGLQHGQDRGGVSKWWRRGVFLMTGWILAFGGMGDYIKDNGGPVVGSAKLAANFATSPIDTTLDVAGRGAGAVVNQTRDGIATGFRELSDIGSDDAKIQLGSLEVNGDFHTVDGLDGDSNIRGYGTAIVDSEQLTTLIKSSEDVGASGNFLQKGLSELGDLIGADDLMGVDEFKILIQEGDKDYVAQVKVLDKSSDNDGAFLLALSVLDDQQSDDMLKKLKGKAASQKD